MLESAWDRVIAANLISLSAISHNRDWQNNNKLDWAFNNVRLRTGILSLTWFKVQEFGCTLFRAIVSIVWTTIAIKITTVHKVWRWNLGGQWFILAGIWMYRKSVSESPAFEKKRTLLCSLLSQFPVKNFGVGSLGGQGVRTKILPPLHSRRLSLELARPLFQLCKWVMGSVGGAGL